ncbi:centrosomal protein of 170 kDa isoform X2 [Pseudophryne corroboree]|uniref:centrosomal protein of 170 kDa isoform X2 n=1 Tax=Pseudophryne corroboree TaxID=495146 RepID=UPI0030812659
MSVTSWFLVSSGGTRHRLPREMIFVGRDDCELMLQSRSVDKQHAVINYEPSTDEHLVKDLGSLNGTFVNDIRILEQTYITLKLDDKLRFGYDTNLFTVVRGEMKVPEEALKHEKFTSQLHFSQKHFEAEGSKSKSADARMHVPTEVHQKSLDSLKTEEKVPVDLSAMPRGTPLYGQPSWWGDEDAAGKINNQDSKESRLHDASAAGFCKYGKKFGEQIKALKEEAMSVLGREPSYFEIPSKDLQQKSEAEENTVYEVPTQDPQCSQVSGAGHASFTIEFDDSSPGKVTIKDHVTKFMDHRQKGKKVLSGDKELAGLNAEMIAAESKVADWLAQNNPPRLLKEAAEDDAKSIKSDVPVYLKRLQGNKHEDGTQSDYENGASLKRINKITNLQDHARQRNLEQRKLDQKIQTGRKQQDTASQTAFLIEFLDDDHPRKRRSYSFSLNASATGPEAPYPIPQSRIEKVKAASADPKGLLLGLQSGSSSHRVIHSTQHAKLLLKQKSEEPCTSLLFSQNVLLRSSGSLGHRPTNKRVTPHNADLSPVEKDYIDSQLDDNTNAKEEVSPPEAKDVVTASGKKLWVSQWASLASNHVGHDQDNGKSESSMLASENDGDMSESGASHKGESATSVTSQNDCKRRTLPKLPKEECDSLASVSKFKHRADIGEKQDTELQEKEVPSLINKKDNLYVSYGRSMDKPGKLLDSSLEKTGNLADYSRLSSEASRKDGFLPANAVKKQVICKAQREQTKEQPTSAKLSSKPPAAQLCKGDSLAQHLYKLQKSVEMPHEITKKNDVSCNNHVKNTETEKKEHIKPLVRQGSFTIDKPSSNVPIELIPHINKQSVFSPSFPFTSVNNIRERSDSVDTDSSMDTTFLLKDTEAVMAFLEAKLRDESKPDEDPKTPSYTQDNSISPESDVDTASTISFVAGDLEKKCPQKRKSLSSLHKEKSSTSSPSKDPPNSSAAMNRERNERKSKPHVKEVATRTEIRKVLRTSARNRPPSLDLTDDDQTSSLPCSAVSDILSSDQETYSRKPLTKAQFASADDKCATSKATAANKSITLPRPRPTRTSLLRRSRLGETSDTEIGDTDRASVASEVSTTSSTSKQPTGKKPFSRIDLLAQPRRTRLGSLSARSDSEATISKGSGSSRTAEYASRSGLKSATTDGKSSPRARANSISRLSDAKTKTAPPSHSSPSANTRWRRIPPEYASTSEDEFGSKLNSPKPTRLRASPTIKVQRSQGTGNSPVIAQSTALNVSTFKHKAKEQEDYIRDWTAHREEIARISQDLALIAREINDVAGEIDSVTSSGTAPSTTVSTAATTPGSAIDTREEVGDLHEDIQLVDRVFDESLNFRKIPPTVPKSETNSRAGDSKSQPKENSEPQVITRRKTWSRDDVMGDSLLLSSVFQFSRKIRQTIDKTANKIRILFKDKERNWDEIEKKLRAESEIPIFKTSCVEILSILQELKRIEKQLQVINAMIDPDGSLDALNLLGFGTPLPPPQPKPKRSSSVHNVSSTLSTRCQTDSRTSRPNIVLVSSDLDGVESDPDFSIHFNRFNPDGKEDSTLHE